MVNHENNYFWKYLIYPDEDIYKIKFVEYILFFLN
jgi:hypothetical protein